MTLFKSYAELITLPTFEERLEYLKLNGSVGRETFGYDRYLNQILYRCQEWLELRPHIITRDKGCDLAVFGLDILDSTIIVHHINPITVEMILTRDPLVFDPDNLVTSRQITHNIIHYGTVYSGPLIPVERRPNDMCPWKK